jgi:histidine ammonia-lyase
MRSEPVEPRPVQVGVQRLELSEVVGVARHSAPVAALTLEARERLEATASWVARTVDEIVSPSEPRRRPTAYYGINTGFGALAGRTALDSVYLIKALGRNLIASHSVGVGRYFDLPVVRAAMLVRAQSLAQGYSGVRPLIVETLCRMLNCGVYPAVPEQGSLGASGDLAPLAHLVLTMSAVPRAEAGAPDLDLDATDGEAFLRHDGPAGAAGAVLHLTEDHATGEQTLWRRATGSEAMSRVGGKVELEAKEALALTNGSTFSAALGVLSLHDARNLLDHAALVVAMTLEGIRGFRDPFYPEPHRVRRHEAAARFASEVLSYLEGSELLDPGDLGTNPMRVPPQDPYSIRCAPQVHGTIADTLDLVQRWVEMEINAVTDNPLIFLGLERSYKTLSGGNFHGEPIAMAMDFLAIALTEMGSMSDRRMFVMNDYHPDKTYEDTEAGPRPAHGLSSFLIDEPKGLKGLNTGLMMLQATAAALVSDCKVLAHPDSVDTIPSSGNQEDHVSMSLNAARHARDIVANIEQVLALEFLCAAQAIYLQRAKTGNGALRMGAGTGAAYAALRAAGVSPLTQDRVLFPDIRRVVTLLRSGELLEAARRAAAACSVTGGSGPC